MKLPIFQVELLLFPRHYGSSWDVAGIYLPLEVVRGPLVFTLGFLVSRKVGIWFSLAASVAANTNEWNFCKCDLRAHVSFEIFWKCYRLTYRLTFFGNLSSFHREWLKLLDQLLGQALSISVGHFMSSDWRDRVWIGRRRYWTGQREWMEKGLSLPREVYMALWGKEAGKQL